MTKHACTHMTFKDNWCAHASSNMLIHAHGNLRAMKIRNDALFLINFMLLQTSMEEFTFLQLNTFVHSVLFEDLLSN